MNSELCMFVCSFAFFALDVCCMHGILVYPCTQYNSKVRIVLGYLDSISYSFLSVIQWLMFIFTFIRNKYGVECRLCCDFGEYREYRGYTRSNVHVYTSR